MKRRKKEYFLSYQTIETEGCDDPYRGTVTVMKNEFFEAANDKEAIRIAIEKFNPYGELFRVQRNRNSMNMKLIKKI